MGIMIHITFYLNLHSILKGRIFHIMFDIGKILFRKIIIKIKNYLFHKKNINFRSLHSTENMKNDMYHTIHYC